MDARTLGRTGIRATRIGLGLAALGRPGYINVGHAEDLEGAYAVGDMEARAHAVLDAAWAAGVRYFDAARSYGRAEDFLGGWLRARRIAPADVAVGSKWGYTYTAGWRVDAEVHEVKDHTLPVLRRQLAETRERLGEYLRLYQVHSATLESGVLDDADVLDALAALRAEGVAVGLSLSGAGQADALRRAMEVERDGRPLFGAVQATWNLLERSADDALREAHAAGVGVVVKEALANGRLTARNDDPRFAAPRTALEEQAARLDTTVDALALAAVLARPWADVVLSGAAAADHLRSNVAALDVAWDEEAEAALAPLAADPTAYWSERSGMAWN
jgi:aryl-alcohol dehydrogenase-like predicted oxidoreductase